MKKIALVVACSISLAQAAALRPAGVHTKISPAVFAVFTRAVNFGWINAQAELNRHERGELALVPQGPLAKLFNDIRREGAYEALGDYPKARRFSLATIALLNSKKDIREHWSYAKANRSSWAPYMQAIDIALLCMQQRETPQINQNNLLRNLALHNQIKELMLNNQTINISPTEMNYVVANLFGKLGAMEGMLQADTEAFKVIFGEVATENSTANFWHENSTADFWKRPDQHRCK